MHDPALQLAIFGRMALAATLGFLVGFEREARGKTAGERTIALAGVGFYLTAILATAITMLILELEFMPVIGPLLHRMAPGSPDRTTGSPDPEHD